MYIGAALQIRILDIDATSLLSWAELSGSSFLYKQLQLKAYCRDLLREVRNFENNGGLVL